MSVLETAIRNALARSDRGDAAIRAKVYHSARAALDNGLLKQGIVDTAVIAAQRDRLEALINVIEAEEQEAILAAEEADRAFRGVPEPTNADPANMVPEVVSDRRNENAWQKQDDPSLMDAVPSRREPVEEIGPTATERQDQKPKQKKIAKTKPAEVQGEKRVRRSRARSSIFTRIFVFGILLAFAIGAAVWVQQSGLWALIQQHGMDLVNSDVSEDNDTTPLIKNPLDPRRSFDESWLEIFAGTDASALETGGDAAVEPAKAADGAFALITSGSGSASGEVSVPVSANILSQLAGKSSTLALTVGSGDDTSSQLSVECNFGSLGDCGRHRFNVTAERADFLFKVKFPAAAGAGSAGKLILNSDVSGNGKAVKLYAIRVLPGE